MKRLKPYASLAAVVVRYRISTENHISVLPSKGKMSETACFTQHHTA